MMKRNVILPLLGAVLLTACGEAQAEPVSTQQTTAAATTAVSTGTTAQPEATTAAVSAAAAGSTVQTTSAAVTQTSLLSVTSKMPETTTAASALTVPVTETTVTRLQGGGGGEEHAEDIDPLYFNYLFGEDEAAVRLAGGTYQVIPYDFGDALEHDVDTLYYLQDADFDGDLDLCVPVHFADTDTEYAVFRWGADTKQFDVQPVLLMNPVFHAEKKQITASQHSTETKRRLTRYGWENGALVTLETAEADSRMLTLVRQVPDGEKNVLKPENEAEFEKAVNDFLA